MSDDQPAQVSAADKLTAWIVGGAALLVAVGLLTFFVAGPSISRHSGLRQVKKVAAAQLRDPSSAQFRNVERHGSTVCGEINGKNGYGAYSGFSRFYGDKDSVTIDNGDTSRFFHDFPSDAERFDRNWKAYCT